MGAATLSPGSEERTRRLELAQRRNELVPHRPAAAFWPSPPARLLHTHASQPRSAPTGTGKNRPDITKGNMMLPGGGKGRMGKEPPTKQK